MYEASALVTACTLHDERQAARRRRAAVRRPLGRRRRGGPMEGGSEVGDGGFADHVDMGGFLWRKVMVDGWSEKVDGWPALREREKVSCVGGRCMRFGF